jgi:hypothetical protein
MRLSSREDSRIRGVPSQLSVNHSYADISPKCILLVFRPLLDLLGPFIGCMGYSYPFGYGMRGFRSRYAVVLRGGQRHWFFLSLLPTFFSGFESFFCCRTGFLSAYAFECGLLCLQVENRAHTSDAPSINNGELSFRQTLIVMRQNITK